MTEKKYQMLTVSELSEMRNIFSQVSDDPQYNAAKKLYAYIEEHGAIRDDVYRYLLKNMNFHDYSISTLNSLLKTLAEPEWFELVKKTEDREKEYSASTTNIKLFQQNIIDAYRQGVPCAYIASALEAARYPYEVNQRIEQYSKGKNEEIDSIVSGLKAVMEEFRKDMQTYKGSYGQLTEYIDQKDEAIRELHEELEKMRTAELPIPTGNISAVPNAPEEDAASLGAEEDKEAEEPERAEEQAAECQKDKETALPENAESAVRELIEAIRLENELRREETAKQAEMFMGGLQKLFENMAVMMNPAGTFGTATGPEPADAEKQLRKDGETTGGELEKPEVEDPPELQEDEQDMPDIQPDEPESGEKPQTESATVTVCDIREEIKRMTLFQKIKNWKRKIYFGKMSNEKKLEELFKMINERNYNETMIFYVRKCLGLKVSFEFLYAFIEMGAGEDEFKKLILFREEKTETGGEGGEKQGEGNPVS